MSKERDELAESLRSGFGAIIKEADEWRPLAVHFLKLVSQRLAEAREEERRKVINALGLAGVIRADEFPAEMARLRDEHDAGVRDLGLEDAAAQCSAKCKEGCERRINALRSLKEKP